MNVAARVALFAALLALAFGGAFAAGRAIDPNPGTERAPAEHDSGTGGHP